MGPITQFSYISFKKSKISSLSFLDTEIRKLQYGTAANFGCIFLAKLNEKPCLNDIEFKISHIANLFYSLMHTLMYILFNKFKKKYLLLLEAEICKLQYGLLATYRFI